MKRPNAWRFRDYVIDRLNNDVPWDRFIREQLAADVFFPDKPHLTAALGFIAANRPQSVILKNFPANKDYTLQWWDIDKGLWQDKTVVATSAAGTAELPTTPDKNRSWAFRLLQNANGNNG